MKISQENRILIFKNLCLSMGYGAQGYWMNFPSQVENGKYWQLVEENLLLFFF